MASIDDQIREQNPWWADPDAIRRDPVLARLRASPFVWRPPVMEALDPAVGERGGRPAVTAPGPGAVHTLRGPRQVGKTTTLKLLVERLLAAGERRVMYFSFDLARDSAAIVDTIRRARQLHPQPEGRWFVFLDEVTTVPEWQRGVKYAVDQGMVANDYVLCTGSSARRMGPELMPGRRGWGRDHVQLPISFRDFCAVTAGVALPPPVGSVGELLGADGARAVREAALRLPELRATLDRYLVTGGFPAAVAEAMADGEPTRSVETLWSLVAGEIQHAGRDAVAALKLLERVGRGLGTPLSWRALAEDMDVDHPSTAREYVTSLARSFVLLVVWHWDPGNDRLRAQKQRKVYYLDPLFDAIVGRLVPGRRPSERAGLLEGVVAGGLYRAATRNLVQAEPAPGAVGVWRSARGTEIDFVLPESVPDLRAPRLPLEVKGDSRTAISNARKSIRATFGRGLIATESLLDLDVDVPALPAAVLLALLPEDPVRVEIVP